MDENTCCTVGYTGLWVYILICQDGTLYTGMTNDLMKRVRQHQQKTARCKFTRRSDKHPLRLGAAWQLDGIRGDALSLERFIKRLRRTEKHRLLADPSTLEKILIRDDFPLSCSILPYSGELTVLEESI